MRLPYAAVEFTTSGEPADDQQVGAAVKMMRDKQATDVLLLAHGWNNDIPKAERLFERLVDRLAPELQPTTRTVVVVGLLWPAVQWADDDDIAGGGVSIVDPRAALDAAIAESVEDPAAAAALRAAADQLETSAGGREAFVAALRPLLPADGDGGEDPVPEALAEGDAEALFAAAEEAEALADDDELFADAADAAPQMPPGIAPDLLGVGAATGTGVNIKSALVDARRLLNVTTYYLMKDRAGKVGSRGVTKLVRRLRQERPDVAVHLAGHSFGARVVSAAAASSDVPIDSVTLLQGAFSHFGFAHNYADSGKDGAFRRALTGGQLRGPILITHTHNDRAVATAYAVASRIARQTGAALVGGPNDPYGGVGANGALGTDEALDRTLLAKDANYDFTARRIYNLRADTFVSGHSAVTGPEVAHALAAAMTANR